MINFKDMVETIRESGENISPNEKRRQEWSKRLEQLLQQLGGQYQRWKYGDRKIQKPKSEEALEKILDLNKEIEVVLAEIDQEIRDLLSAKGNIKKELEGAPQGEIKNNWESELTKTEEKIFQLNEEWLKNNAIQHQGILDWAMYPYDKEGHEYFIKNAEQERKSEGTEEAGVKTRLVKDIEQEARHLYDMVKANPNDSLLEHRREFLWRVVQQYLSVWRNEANTLKEKFPFLKLWWTRDGLDTDFLDMQKLSRYFGGK